MWHERWISIENCNVLLNFRNPSSVESKANFKFRMQLRRNVVKGRCLDFNLNISSLIGLQMELIQR